MLVGSRFCGTPMRHFSRAVPRNFFFGFPAVGSLLRELDVAENVGPRVTVKGKGDNVLIEFDVPRYKLADICVSGKNGTLTVKGKTANQPAQDEHFVYGEAPSTSFNRSFSVPNTYDMDKLTTVLDHGVLTVTIPKAPKPAEVPAPPVAESGLEVSATSTDLAKTYNDVATMSWPPMVKVDETAKALTYKMQLPESIHKDSINLKLLGRTLNVVVSHTKNVTKKDSKGNVVFSENQSVNFSTPLSVPAGTTASDISSTLEKGVLTVAVAPHNAAQTVKVN